MKRTIILTGGGTAGHVTVNLALIPHLIRKGWNIHYIGSERGIERELIAGIPDVTYHSISTGKLRRYFDWNNVKDPFRVLKGIWQAYRVLAKERPHIVFSKGGFVSVPVIGAAWLHRIPAIIHESDLTPGLANRIAIPLSSKVCTTFPDTSAHVPETKAVHVGAVVREELFQGKAELGFALCRFQPNKPVLLVMGGSMGSQKINQAIRSEIKQLTKTFQIVHICGKGNVEAKLDSEGYRQFEYVTGELPDLLAMADVVVSRAGSNSIFEFLALRKPMLLIPLSLAASRGDQIANAESFRKRGVAAVLQEEEMTAESFVDAVHQLYDERDTYLSAIRREEAPETPLQALLQLIEETAMK